jgi:hypothetical protein
MARSGAGSVRPSWLASSDHRGLHRLNRQA